MFTEARKKKLETFEANRQKDVVVVLEDIHDPHNVQAIVRTCDAFGIGTVYLIFEKETPFDPKLIGKGSSSTANKWVDYHIFSSTKNCLDHLKKQNFTIIATALTDHATSLLSTKFDNQKVALLLGNEHAGLSHTALLMADKTIIIPMVGMVQSLNVSVTAAICIWEIVRQRTSNV